MQQQSQLCSELDTVSMVNSSDLIVLSKNRLREQKFCNCWDLLSMTSHLPVHHVMTWYLCFGLHSVISNQHGECVVQRLFTDGENVQRIIQRQWLYNMNNMTSLPLWGSHEMSWDNGCCVTGFMSKLSSLVSSEDCATNMRTRHCWRLRELIPK